MSSQGFVTSWGGEWLFDLDDKIQIVLDDAILDCYYKGPSLGWHWVLLDGFNMRAVRRSQIRNLGVRA